MVDAITTGPDEETGRYLSRGNRYAWRGLSLEVRYALVLHELFVSLHAEGSGEYDASSVLLARIRRGGRFVTPARYNCELSCINSFSFRPLGRGVVGNSLASVLETARMRCNRGGWSDRVGFLVESSPGADCGPGADLRQNTATGQYVCDHTATVSNLGQVCEDLAH